ncbi:HEAT repeat domain-containing protein [Pontibacter sp. G13]|uniref:HEAT repeat domain-containing protein n=1 Tax=Pontibacter sp. G13 TaxID=3074898 RepID=UPI00288B3C48|nr:HEAT repeat domain-containing protein [Pontibacter sp. G13]WNJ17291.1 HEAT repeat domain-containing protein [Pontibacter sp. G13]
MNNEAAMLRLMDFLEQNEHKPSEAQLTEFFQAHPVCKPLWEEMELVMEPLSESRVPEPTDQMDTKFFESLTQWEQEEAKPTWQDRLQSWWKAQQSFKLGWGWFLAALVIGIWIGGGFSPSEPASDNEMASLQSEVQDLREMMALSLLQQPAATQRLQAVNISQQLTTVDQEVIMALVETLQSDPNTNVRLATIDALVAFADHPEAREGLVQSIAFQESPMVLLELADAMVRLREGSAKELLLKAAEQQHFDGEFKEQVREKVEFIM